MNYVFFISYLQKSITSVHMSIMGSRLSNKLYTLLLVLLLWLTALVFWFLIVTFLDVNKLTSIPQSTIITDRDGNELYRFFEEDRRRVAFDSISPYMIQAIVAVEDQTFRQNNWTDKSWLMRAIVSNIKTLWEEEWQVQWWSTITQQLVKNIYLTKQKTISRKMQELVLAIQLTTKLTRAFAEQWHSLPDAKKEAKKTIMTAYLNYVFFWNRSYGIEAAARNYFKKSPADLSILESAILASLPQAPSLYNPSLRQEPILGYWTVWSGTILEGMQFTINQSQASRLVSVLSGTTLSTRWSCLDSLIDWATVSTWWQTYVYSHGRKDRALCRMVENGFITSDQLATAFLQGATITFNKASYAIKSPHFVFRIQDILLQMPFFRQSDTSYEQISQWWYTIVTTLDSGLQQAAQDAMDNYANWLKGLWGNNRALIHVKSTNWDVVTYLWSQNFSDEAIDGQVDVLRSIRQVGSTLKPFFYAYLFTHFPFAIDGNILDYPFMKNGPQNHDGLVRWKTQIATALAWSRNLPVVRMFFAFGGEKVFVPFLQSLGFTKLDPENKQYGYPLVLGSDEATLTQLAQAYIQLSTVWDFFPEINPIARILAPDGAIIYQKPTSRFRKVIPETVWDMLWRILSNQRNMPQDWRRLRNLPVKNLALKTWTSDIKVRWKPYPRDGVSVVYGPEDVIVSRAGNTDGSAMWSKAFGGEINHYPLREYLADAIASWKIIDQPRISPNPDYASWWRYRGAEGKSLTPEQEVLLWGAK